MCTSLFDYIDKDKKGQISFFKYIEFINFIYEKEDIPNILAFEIYNIKKDRIISPDEICLIEKSGNSDNPLIKSEFEKYQLQEYATKC